ncbi:hypothetical protein [Amycolatopsis taiwanensis]|uniref:Uncharacterized protein n=1 Tax=Amycolatopsis taiwanensis TaxID=342230 RepID=A0A9W6R361_9PSEU|nr:hypothetical protein [Amycolatopsis taiwanensis]GLY68666.1 hypothetical protein Atai01_52850 [Amycolatopsis taiwanensis]
MAEHARGNDVTDGTPRAGKGGEVDWRRVKNQAFRLLADIVRWAGLLLAAVLVLHVIFVVGSANPANAIVSWVRGWADTFAIGFQDLFEPGDAKLRVLVNFGIAALFWLIASGIVARIIRRIGGGAP